MLRQFARACVCLTIVLGAVAGHAAPADRRSAVEKARLPLIFEANQGQTDGAVSVLANGTGFRLWLSGADATLALNSRDPKREPSIVRMRLDGSRRGVRAVGEAPLATRVNYLVGNDPATWHRNVPTYSHARLAGVYPGIDAVYYGNEGRLEYDFVVAPGADPDVIALRFDGADRLSLREGDIVLQTANGELALRHPEVYQNVNGARRTIAARYVLGDAGDRVTLALGAYDRSRELVIDPTFDYATLLGGNLQDSANAIKVDANGAAFVAGWAHSATFPTPMVQNVIGAPITPQTQISMFVAKVLPDGSNLEYLTYLGGGNIDVPSGLAIDGVGHVFVSGQTSPTFPIVHGFAPLLTSAPAGMFELDPTGSQILYSTFINGGPNGTADGIAVDNNGIVYVVGAAGNPTPIDPNAVIPTSFNGFRTSAGAQQKTGDGAYVVKIDPTQLGTASWIAAAMYHGAVDVANNPLTKGVRVAVDASSTVYLAGTTSETNLNTPNGFQTTYGGGHFDAFVARFSSDLLQLEYATYVGGEGDEFFYITNGTPTGGVAADDAGNVWIGGTTFSAAFPISMGPATLGNADGFVAMFDTNQSGAASRAWSTLFGGSDADYVRSIAVDPVNQNAYITGSVGTGSVSFPTTQDAVQQTPPAGAGGAFHAFLTRLSKTGDVVYSTYVASKGTDNGNAVAIDAHGHAWVAGDTLGIQFPVTAGAFQTARQGDYDGFVVKIGTNGSLTDLSIDKRADVQAVSVGGQIVYTIIVTNNGSSTAHNVTIADLLQKGSVLVSAQPTPECTQANPVVCTFASLAPGAQVTATITVTTDGTNLIESQQAPLKNTALVEANETDIDQSNNSSTTSVMVSANSADLTIDEQANAPHFLAGQSITYTIHVVNNGPNPAPNVVVNDFMAAAVTPAVASTNVPGGSCAGMTCTLGTLASGATATVTITGVITAGGPLHNSASVTSNAYDPTTPNVASVDVAVDAAANLSIKKVASAATVQDHAPLTYTLTVTNAGPSVATGVQLIDTLPSEVLFVSASLPGCSQFSPIVCPLPDLPMGGQAVVTIAVTTKQAGNAVTNTATVSSTTPDPDLSDNTASVSTLVTPLASIQIVKSAPQSVVFVGSPVVYQMLITNVGPDVATNVTVTDTLPAGLTYLPAASSPQCQSNLQVPPTISCTLASLQVNGAALFTVAGDTPVAGSFTNIAAVAATETASVTKSLPVTVTVKQRQANLKIVKTSSTLNPVVNVPFTYTFTVINVGPYAATNLIVSDTLPAALAFVSSSSCQLGPSAPPQVVTCKQASLAVNANVQFTITVKAKNGGSITNIASVTAVEPDATPANRISPPVTVTAKDSADVSVALSATASQVTVLGSVTYTVITKNSGPAAAGTVTTVITFQPAPPPMFVTPPSGCSYAYPAGAVTCSQASMAPGASTSRQIVLKATMTGTVTTTAQVTAASPVDPDLSNNTAVWSLAVKRPSLSALIGLLNQLVLVGDVSPEAARQLQGTLNTVNTLFGSGENAPGSTLLTSTFIPQVSQLTGDGSVTREAGDALIAAARAVMN